MGALLALIPARDWFWGAISVGALIIGWHYYDKYENAIQYQQTVQAESDKALSDARKTIADNAASYADALNKLEAQHATDTAASAAQHAADLDRLRKLAAARQGGPVLPSPPASGARPDTGDGSSGSVGGVFVDANVCADLAGALRNARDDLAAAYAERDALTGK